mmetsp:Transcript_30818/g.65124  ORF Transcript_30818/g.65124 Transcript_30818/m.65124 type:complete len:225 (+) Transcript_30818:385-1059(+)
MFAGLTACCLFGVAETPSFGLIHLRLSLKHALFALTSPINLFRSPPPTPANMQRQHLLHRNRRPILALILHIRLIRHGPWRKVIIRQCIQLRTQMCKQLLHLLLCGILLRLFLVGVAIVSGGLLEVFPFVQFAQSELGFFLAYFGRVAAALDANVGQFAGYDIVPVLVQDAFLDHLVNAGGMFGGEYGRWLECHFEFGCGVEKGIGLALTALGFSHHFPWLFGH